jgi:hypothetical protein
VREAGDQEFSEVEDHLVDFGDHIGWRHQVDDVALDPGPTMVVPCGIHDHLS